MRGWRQLAIGRRWFIALAALALMVQVLVPQGFMISGAAAAPAIVICTGHGPLLAVDDHGRPVKPSKPAPDAPCGFAAHGAAVGPSAPVAIAATPFEAPAVLIPRPFAVAPGLGLAAPPPPSHAPPAPLI